MGRHRVPRPVCEINCLDFYSAFLGTRFWWECLQSDTEWPLCELLTSASCWLLTSCHVTCIRRFSWKRCAVLHQCSCEKVQHLETKLLLGLFKAVGGIAFIFFKMSLKREKPRVKLVSQQNV